MLSNGPGPPQVFQQTAAQPLDPKWPINGPFWAPPSFLYFLVRALLGESGAIWPFTCHLGAGKGTHPRTARHDRGHWRPGPGEWSPPTAKNTSSRVVVGQFVRVATGFNLNGHKREPRGLGWRETSVQWRKHRRSEVGTREKKGSAEDGEERTTDKQKDKERMKERERKDEKRVC